MATPVCEICASPLVGRRKRFCSDACRLRWLVRTNPERARRTAAVRGDRLRDRHRKPTTPRRVMGELEHRREARLMLGRPLLPGEVVYHLNGDMHDNRPENLVVITRRHPLWVELMRRAARTRWRRAAGALEEERTSWSGAS